MKVLIFLAAWKRPEITEICFMGLNRLKNTRFAPEAFCVISEESMIPLCEKYGIHWAMHENLPLGKKKNFGLSESLKLEWDYLIEIGSDDLIKDELLELYEPFFGKYDMFGTKSTIVINSADGECINLKSDTPYGLGRAISRKVIEKHCIGVYVEAFTPIISIGRSTRPGEVGFFKLKQAEHIQKAGQGKIVSEKKVRLWNDDINKGLDNNSNYFLITQGVGHKGIATEKPLTIDIKGPDNIWPFNKRLGSPYPLDKALEGLSEQEQESILDLCRLSTAR